MNGQPCTHIITAVVDGRTVQTWRAATEDAALTFAAALRAADLRRRYEIRPAHQAGRAA